MAQDLAPLPTRAHEGTHSSTPRIPLPQPAPAPGRHLRLSFWGWSSGGEGDTVTQARTRSSALCVPPGPRRRCREEGDGDGDVERTRGEEGHREGWALAGDPPACRRLISTVKVETRLVSARGRCSIVTEGWLSLPPPPGAQEIPTAPRVGPAPRGHSVPSARPDARWAGRRGQ